MRDKLIEEITTEGKVYGDKAITYTQTVKKYERTAPATGKTYIYKETVTDYKNNETGMSVRVYTDNMRHSNLNERQTAWSQLYDENGNAVGKWRTYKYADSAHAKAIEQLSK